MATPFDGRKDNPKIPTNKDFKSERTIVSLNLGYEDAMKGKVWALLPPGFRYTDAAEAYPVPNKFSDLMKLSAIPIAPNLRSPGVIYLKRCRKACTEFAKRRQSALLDLSNRRANAKTAYDNYRHDMLELREKMKAEKNRVRQTAEECIASLNDLFKLGRRGLDGMMRAHLEGSAWQGETINAAAFRQCFGMITAAVKGLGAATGDQKTSAREAALEEVAASLEDTQAALAMAPGSEKPQ